MRYLGLYTALVIKYDPDNPSRPKGADGSLPVIKIESLKSIPIWTKEDIAWLQHPALSIDHEKELARYERDIDRLGFAALENLSAEASGYARSVTLKTARQRFDRIVKRLSLGYEQICERFLEVVKNIPNGEEVYVYKHGEDSKGFVSLKAADLTPPYRLSVSIPSPVPPDLLALAQAVTSFRQGSPPFYPDRLLLEQLLFLWC